MTQFEKKVINAIKMIPSGKVTTYGEIARCIGNVKAVRAVGNAVSKNPDLLIVPCHRVVRSDGKIGGYSKGTQIKIELLKEEGIYIKGGKVIDFKKKLYKYD